MLEALQKIFLFPAKTVFRLITWPFARIWTYLFGMPIFPLKDDIDVLTSPIFWEGNNGRAVLLVHGWSSTPYEMRALAEKLHAHGYTVSVPLLSGHGTVPKDLENISWRDWLGDVQKAYDELAARGLKVFVGGMSIGGTLAAIIGAKNDVSGTILLGTPHEMRREKLHNWGARLQQKFFKYKKKSYPLFSPGPNVTKMITYQTYPLSSAIEALDLVRFARNSKIFNKLKKPLLVIQAKYDHLICRDSVNKILDCSVSKHKYKKIIPDAYHNFIADKKHRYIYEDILNFLEEQKI